MDHTGWGSLAEWAAVAVALICALVSAISGYSARGLKLAIADIRLAMSGLKGELLEKLSGQALAVVELKGDLSEQISGHAIALETLKTSIVSGRAEDMNEQRAWINGSFMRAKETQGALQDVERRVDAIDKRLEVAETRRWWKSDPKKEEPAS